MLEILEKRAGGPIAAARMLGIPYTSTYARLASGKRNLPLYIKHAIMALLMLPDQEFRDLQKERDFLPSADLPWVVLLATATTRNGVADSGGRYENEENAQIAAKRLIEFGIEKAVPTFRPFGVKLAKEAAL